MHPQEALEHSSVSFSYVHGRSGRIAAWFPSTRQPSMNAGERLRTTSTTPPPQLESVLLAPQKATVATIGQSTSLLRRYSGGAHLCLHYCSYADALARDGRRRRLGRPC